MAALCGMIFWAAVANSKIQCGGSVFSHMGVSENGASLIENILIGQWI
jgi:hypothetical protein